MTTPERAARGGLKLATALQILEHAGRLDPDGLELEPQAQLQTIIDALCDLSMRDGLTGLMNAGYFRSTLKSELERCARTGHTCALMLLDLDRFKLVNDTYGHQTGDLVLKTFATQLAKVMRGMDLAARMGGDEFAVLLPECAATDAVRAAKRIHEQLNRLIVPAGDVTLDVTVSAGMVWTQPETETSPKSFLARADEELYRAKRSGGHALCHPHLVATRISAAEHASLIIPSLEEEECYE
jgi:diguanylate cyclase (GGDEF)-like protein